MRTEMVIRMRSSSEKGNAKAMKVAAATDGVESVTLAGEGRDLLRVVGDGVDSNHLTSRLRRKVGRADIVELRTLQGRGYTATDGAGGYYSTSTQQLVGDGDAYGGGQYYSNSYPAASYSPAAAAGGYYNQQPSSYQYEYYPPAPYATTVVHHEYPAPAGNGGGNCTIM